MKECKFEGKTAKKNKRQINGKIAISDSDKTKMMKVMMSVPNKHSIISESISSILPQKILVCVFFTEPSQDKLACIHMKTFMDHATAIMLLYNMGMLCNMRTTLCNVGALFYFIFISPR